MRAGRPGWPAVFFAAWLLGLAGGVLPALALTTPDILPAAVSRRDLFGRFQNKVKGLISQGRRALGRGRLEAAAEYFRRALELDPANREASALLRRVQAAASARRAESAHRRREEARRKLIAETLAQAEAALAAGRPLQARAQYRRVLALDPANSAAQAGLDRVRRALLDRPAGQAIKRAVFRAARAGDEAALAKILDEYPAACRVTDAGGRTPLHWAAFSGLVSVTAELLARGARPDPGDRRGQTPLHLAAARGQVGAAALLLRAGARPSVRDRRGETPLHLAAARDHWAVAALLLDRGAKINAVDRRGFTPLLSAAYYGRPLTARLLIDRGAKLDAGDNLGRTAYAVATRLCPANKKARDCAGVRDLLSARGLTR